MDILGGGLVGRPAQELQALAMPDTLVISEATRRQVGALFEIEDLGLQPLAGFATPQRAWRVVGRRLRCLPPRDAPAGRVQAQLFREHRSDRADRDRLPARQEP